MEKDKILEIEEKIAYLDLANFQLEDEVYRQKLEIEALTTSVKTLEALVEVINGGLQTDKPSTLDFPPHY
ncbi:MAG: hypothetical protein CMK36_08375 [Porticoccaceae bacterium]|nr:hypothetical protein [Porticoccaceae bacterium]|tara:strand:- start:4414 stop:4623 length:210 start_codon:yes stop_codon:yes gene_type:complete